MPAAQLAKLPPNSDVVFRRLFDEEDDARLLRALLNGVLAYPPERRIASLSLSRTQLPGRIVEDKEVILDLRAVAADGRHYHIEVQLADQPCFAARMLYYWAGIYHSQLARAGLYGELQAVVSLNFLSFALLKDPAHRAYHHVFRARADGDGAILCPHFEIHTFEMTKGPPKGGGAQRKWVLYLKRGHEMTETEVAGLGVPEIIEVDKKLTMISQSRDLQVEYQRRKMAHHDALSRIGDSLRVGREEGLKAGRLDGIRMACELLDIKLTPKRQELLTALDLGQIEALQAYLKQQRRWPTSWPPGPVDKEP